MNGFWGRSSSLYFELFTQSVLSLLFDLLRCLPSLSYKLAILIPSDLCSSWPGSAGEGTVTTIAFLRLGDSQLLLCFDDDRSFGFLNSPWLCFFFCFCGLAKYSSV